MWFVLLSCACDLLRSFDMHAPVLQLQPAHVHNVHQTFILLLSFLSVSVSAVCVCGVSVECPCQCACQCQCHIIQSIHHIFGFIHHIFTHDTTCTHVPLVSRLAASADSPTEVVNPDPGPGPVLKQRHFSPMKGSIAIRANCLTACFSPIIYVSCPLPL